MPNEKNLTDSAILVVLLTELLFLMVKLRENVKDTTTVEVKQSCLGLWKKIAVYKSCIFKHVEDIYPYPNPIVLDKDAKCGYRPDFLATQIDFVLHDLWDFIPTAALCPNLTSLSSNRFFVLESMLRQTKEQIEGFLANEDLDYQIDKETLLAIQNNLERRFNHKNLAILLTSAFDPRWL